MFLLLLFMIVISPTNYIDTTELENIYDSELSSYEEDFFSYEDIEDDYKTAFEHFQSIDRQMRASESLI